MEQAIVSIRTELSSETGSLSMVIKYLHEGVGGQMREELRAVEEEGEELSQGRYELEGDKELLEQITQIVQNALVINVT